MNNRECPELCVLTDVLSSGLRWRLSDYEAMLRAELAILAIPELPSQQLWRRDTLHSQPF